MFSRRNIASLFAVVITLVAFTLAPTFAQDAGDGEIVREPVVLENTETFTLWSKITRRQHRVYVSLPADYRAVRQAETRYSVVYFLDGNLVFGAMNEYNWLADYADELPSLIMVGIGSPGNHLSRRELDMGREPHQFLDFIGDELIPLIDSEYRTVAQPAARTVMGHSLGGEFVVTALVNRPELFRRYIATGFSSVEWEKLNGLAAVLETDAASEPVRLFTGAGESDAPFTMRLQTRLEQRPIPGIESTFLQMDDLGHNSSVIPLWIYGLLYVYDD